MDKLSFILKSRITFSPVYRRYLSLFSRKPSFYHAEEYKPLNSLLPLARSSLTSSSYTCERHESILSKCKNSVKNLVTDSVKVRRAGCIVYEKIADEIDYRNFFETFKLSDTFQSWMLIIELHVWMMTVVTIAERHGREFRNSLVDTMWNDVELRISEIGNLRSSAKKEYLKELVSQFQAAVIAYDEGMLSEDSVLAAAAWRTLFSCKLVDPELLENIVLYIRHQIAHLESEPVEKIIMNGSVSFLPLQTIISECKE